MRRVGLAMLFAAALLVFAILAAPARALPLLGPACGGIGQPACAQTPAPSAPAPADCTDAQGHSYIGTADQNPSDSIPMPRLGAPLVPRRADGHLQFGFNDLSYYMRNKNPKTGFSAAQDVAAHVRIGSTTVHMPISWGSLERDRGTVDWSGVDPVYCAHVRAGIGVVFTILGAPKWAVLGGQRCDTFCESPPDSNYDGALKAFAQAAAIRYPKVAAIEAWNEPNHSYFWRSPLPGGPGPDPARYTAILKTIFEGVKSGNASIPVLGGALGNGRNTPDDYTLEDFLSGMYDAGAQRWMDGLSFHSYPMYPHSSGRADHFHKTFDTVRALVAARDYAGRRLWATEMGAALSQTSFPYSEHEQATDLLGYYHELDRSKDVDEVVFHTLIDDGKWGWLKQRDGQNRVFPRPIYCAFADRFGSTVTPTPVAGSQPSTTPAKKAKKKTKKSRKKHARKRHRKHAKKHKHRKPRKHRRKKAHSTIERMDCSKPLALPAA